MYCVKVSSGVAPWKVTATENWRAVGDARAELARRAMVAAMAENFMVAEKSEISRLGDLRTTKLV